MADRRRHRPTHGDVQTSTSGPIVLPPYEKPIGPLTHTAIQQWNQVQQKRNLKHLTASIRQANDLLKDNAGDLHDLLYTREKLFKARSDKRRERGAAASLAEIEMGRKIQVLKETVGQMTVQMEKGVREACDAEEEVAAMQRAFKEVSSNAERGAARADVARLQRATNLSVEQDEDRMDVDVSLDNEAAGTSARSIFDDSMTAHKRNWEGKSLRHRYAENNHYIGFKRIIHDAQNPDSENAPPIPHSSTWFADEEGEEEEEVPVPAKGKRGHGLKKCAREGAVSDDDDLAIAGEKKSLKCPLTLLYFTDPVTSTKCPHSFERQAIQDMITQSGARIGGQRRGEGQRAVNCPCCEKMITMDDLEPDALLLRRVRREQERKNRIEEDDEELENDTRRHSVLKGAKPEPIDDSDVDVKMVTRLPSRSVRDELRVPQTQLDQDEDDDE